MSRFTHGVTGQVVAALRTLLVLTVLLGIAYPLTVTGAAQLLLPGRADGSLVSRHGQLVGSSRIGQSFTAGKDGAPHPAYFQSRPSAAGDGYDPLASSASNPSPDNPQLVKDVAGRRKSVASLDGVRPGRVPADAALASGSGLDPDISPAYADLQVRRVASARGVPETAVRRLVDRFTQHRTLGFLGEDRVNVLLLNLALDRAFPTSRGAD
jgi:K+-transporting ATPase ATPase C chain